MMRLLQKDIGALQSQRWVKSMNKRLTNIKCWTEKVSFKMFPKDCRVWFSANAVRQREYVPAKSLPPAVGLSGFANDRCFLWQFKTNTCCKHRPWKHGARVDWPITDRGSTGSRKTDQSQTMEARGHGSTDQSQTMEVLGHGRLTNHRSWKHRVTGRLTNHRPWKHGVMEDWPITDHGSTGSRKTDQSQIMEARGHGSTESSSVGWHPILCALWHAM